jgi:putative Mn2+ efflux pump MntP
MESLGFLVLPALSLDTLIIAMVLARHGSPWRTVLLLSGAEAIAPLLGYGVGYLAFGLLPAAAAIGSAVVLLLLGVHLVREAREGDEAAEAVAGRGPLLGALAVGLDELGIGAALPSLHLSPLPAVLWLLVQAPFMAMLGLWLGRKVAVWAPLRYLPGVLILGLGMVQSVQVALLLR